MSTTEPTKPRIPAPTVNAAGVDAIRRAYERTVWDLRGARRQHFEASEKEQQAADSVRQLEEYRRDLRAALEAALGSPLEPELDLYPEAPTEAAAAVADQFEQVGA